MQKNIAKIRLVTNFFWEGSCLKTDNGKRITNWFKTYDEDVTGEFVLVDTNIGTFLYHKNKAELLYENYSEGEKVCFFKLRKNIYVLETNSTDHAPFIWLYNSNGDKIDMPTLEYIKPINEDLIYGRPYNDNYGILNNKLEWVTECCYREICLFSRGIIAGYRDDDNTTDIISLDKKGNIHIVNIEGYVERFLTKDIIVVQKDNKKGVYNTKTEKILDFAYDDIRYVDNHFILTNNDLKGLADKTGKILCECKYNKIRRAENGFELVTRKIIETVEHITV